MNDLIEGDVRVKGCNIHYYRTGGEKPPMVLAHGMTDNGLCWLSVAKVLGKDYDVIMFDAQGHGLSGRFDREDPKQNGVEHLLGLTDELDIQHSIVMGHSMGANTVASFAAQYPETVRAVILEDPPWRILKPMASQGTSEAGKKRMMLHERGIAMHQRRSLDSLIDHCRRFNPRWSELDILHWSESKMQLDPLFFSAKPAPSPYGSQEDMIRQIACPVLLISGDPLKGGIITSEIGSQVSQLLTEKKKSRWVRIDGAGHNIRREQFQAYCDVILEFLCQSN